ncbi:MAG TPA: transglycosylase domain-containing protein [Nocardioidaceae bacterium]|nr:transglycosylase domain-containing protein [Nocardioidaceae bacterium]
MAAGRNKTGRNKTGRGASQPTGGVLRRALRWMVGLGLACGALGALALFVLYQQTEIPDPNQEFQAETTTVYYADGKHEIGTFAVQNRDAVALSEVPEHVQGAVVAAENRSFWTDPGIDVRGIARAALSNVRSGTTQGASTITQQYVKIMYLSQERTYTRKIKEAILALKVEREVSKEQILQGYLNTIYFGRGAYGVEAAAQAYFGTSAAELSVAEGAVLAAVLNSPANFDPAVDHANRRPLLGRYRYVLAGMAETDVIGERKAARLSRRLPELVRPDDTNSLGGQKGFLLALVEDRLRDEGFSEDEIYGGGLKVVTTFDRAVQRSVVQAVREQRPTEQAAGVHIGVSSVEPGTGALRAMYGGPDYVQDQHNWALIGRQPGSSFKPFALAAGLEQGHALDDTFDGDSLTLPGGHTVHNEFDENFGPITLETATEISSNTAYVDLVTQLENRGADVVDSAVRAGIPEDAPALDPVLVSPLGVADVTPVDMANGYATFAAQGERNDWYVVERVMGADGVARYRHSDRPERAYSRSVANTVSQALQEVVTDPDGTGNAALALDRPAAGKTGTAAQADGDVVSAWFVGYTPTLSTSVMYVRGRDGQGVLDGVAYQDPFAGGGYPARTWTAAMQGALEGMPVTYFTPPIDQEPVEEPYTPPPSPTDTPPAPPTYSPQPSAQPTYTPPPSPELTYTPPPEPDPTPPPSPATPTPTPAPTPTPTPEPTPAATPPTPPGTAAEQTAQPGRR